jgi:Domain of unknown function (DUF4157)
MQPAKTINKTASPIAALQPSKKETDSNDISLKSEPPVLFQAKLSVGAPDDPFEQEADKVSRQVMDNYEQVTSVQRKLFTLGLQTSIQPMPVGNISRKLQRRLFRRPVAQFKCDQCEKEEKEEKLHAKMDRIQFDGDGAVVSSQIESSIQAQRGSGNSMDPITQTAMESSFEADFSSVKIHTDSTAVQMSRDLNAHAFTVGNDIFFNEGRYQPQTKWGAGLLAHELTHVVQQGAAVQNKTISRLPYSDLFSNSTISKLSSVGGSAAQQATLYRKEIAQFQKEVPEGRMLMQQQQMLQAKEIDKVQTHSNAKIMRLYGGDGTPKVKKTEVSPPARGNCGEFSWPIKWSIENGNASTKGWIVQRVNVISSASNCDGSAVNLDANPNVWHASDVPYWEAWKVDGGNVFVGDSATPHRQDTFSQGSVGDNTKGRTRMLGTAEFYPNLALPASFKVRPAHPAKSLPVATTDPGLTGGTGGLNHNLTATWDCCTADKITKVTTE